MASRKSNATEFSGAAVSFLNGVWTDSSSTAISTRDLAFVQGVTAVERVRSYGRCLFQLDRHLDRWEKSTSSLGIERLPTRQELVILIDELVSRNRLWLGEQDYVVVIAGSPGEPGGDSPTLLLAIQFVDEAVCEARVQHGSPLVLTSVQQPPHESWSRHIKVRSRLHYYLADREAAAVCPGALGVLIDSDGTVTETSIANLLIVEHNRLVSPPMDQILPGVSLAVVHDLAEGLGVGFEQERITPDRLRIADEVLLTGTSCGLWFASSIDGGLERKPGQMMRRLRDAFERFAVVDR